MAQKADCTLRSGLFGQPGEVTVDAGGWVCSCGDREVMEGVCVLGTEAVIFLLAAAFRDMFRAMPFSFLSLEVFSAGNALLFSGSLINSVQAIPFSFQASVIFCTGEGLLRYGICAPCKKQAPGVRDAFSEAFGVKKQASTVQDGYSVPETPFSGTGNVCQHPKISGNRYCNRMGRRNVGFDEENQRSFGLLPSNFVSLQNGIEVWCNGSTTDFGSACPSSNLGTSTFLREVRHY